jgi:hypothetical protein
MESQRCEAQGCLQSITSSSVRVTVDYDISIKTAIRRGKYSFVDDIGDDNFAPNQNRSGVRRVLIHFIHFDRAVMIKEVMKGLRCRRVRPADLTELLAIGEQYPQIQRRAWVVALGSSWLRISSSVYVPILSGNTTSRSVLLWPRDQDWIPGCLFASVKT